MYEINNLYLINDFIMTLGVAVMYGNFYNKKRENSIIVFIAYFLYYCSQVWIHSFLNILIFKIIVSFVEYVVLACLHQKDIKKAIIIALYVLMNIFSIEAISALVIGHYWISISGVENGKMTLSECVLSDILGLLVVIVLDKIINKNNDFAYTFKDCISICLVPTGSIIVSLTMIGYSYILQNYLCISSVIILEVTSIICLDKFQNITYKESASMKLTDDIYLLNQFELMRESFESMRSVNHDIQNHLYALRVYIQKNNIEGALEYISKLGAMCYKGQEYIITGNLGIDGILNHKISIAKEMGIGVQTDIKIPVELSLSSFDAITILGNLFDNAIRAVEEIESEKDRNIILSMSYQKSLLFISMKNKYIGEIIWQDEMIITNKSDIKYHGIGIKNIRNVIEKYNGVLDIFCENNIFNTNIIIYV